MIGLSLIPLLALLPSIHYGDIVDEHVDQRGYKPSGHWYPFDAAKIIRMLHYKLYGAWMFKNPIIDRVSLIVMHALVVLMVEVKFGLVPALLFATAPMTLFTGVWRNGRRYTLANIIALIMSMLGPVGLLVYPAIRFAHVGGVSAALMYMVTDSWMFSAVWFIVGIIFIKNFKKFYRIRSKKLPRFLWTFHRSKMILFFKTLGWFCYRMVVPRYVFMYEDWFQNYGIDKENTRGFFKKDKWFYVGILCFLLCLAGLWHGGTRFAVWWFVIFFVPYSNIVTNHQHNNLRYAVLPSIGFYAALSSVLPWWCFIPTIAGNFWCLIMSMRQFTNDVSLYNFHFTYSPKSVAPYFIVGQHCIKSGDAAQAERMARAGLNHSPNHYGLLLVLAQIANDSRQSVLDKMDSIRRSQIFNRQLFFRDQIDVLKKLSKK